MPIRCRRGQRGTSLVELMVVLALLAAMVLVASELVAQSLRLQGAVGRSIRNPLLAHVTGRLRVDIQGSLGVLDEDTIWRDDPLVLRTRDHRLLHYLEADGALVRRTTDLDERLIEERTLMRGLTAWWWRSPVEGVVDLRFGYLVNPFSEHAVARAVGSARERRTESLRFAVRGSWEGGPGW